MQYGLLGHFRGCSKRTGQIQAVELNWPVGCYSAKSPAHTVPVTGTAGLIALASVSVFPQGLARSLSPQAGQCD